MARLYRSLSALSAKSFRVQAENIKENKLSLPSKKKKKKKKEKLLM